MLEATVVLELALGKYVEASIIAGLLAFNVVLGFFQEGRAQATLAALKSRLALNASVRRDNAWRTIPAAGLGLVIRDFRISSPVDTGAFAHDPFFGAGSVLLTVVCDPTAVGAFRRSLFKPAAAWRRRTAGQRMDSGLVPSATATNRESG